MAFRPTIARSLALSVILLVQINNVQATFVPLTLKTTTTLKLLRILKCAVIKDNIGCPKIVLSTYIFQGLMEKFFLLFPIQE